MGQNRSTAVMQRAQAISIGQLWYFTGTPCSRGHIAKRNVSNYECRQCVNDKRHAARLADPEKVRKKDRERHVRTIEARREQSRRSRAKHIEARKQYDRERYQNPERKARQFAQAKRWAKANPDKRNRMVAQRRWWVKRATPAWLTAEDRAAIAAIYAEAASYGKGVMHVDHIVPLRGASVCGLHIPINLQILPASENVKKGNRGGAE